MTCWFAGLSPQYYTGVVWCGYDDPEEVVLTDSSANPATVLWQKVMAKVHEGLANKEFNKPTNVVECTVCQDSGLLMTDACREDPRGSRAITVELSLYDVPTQNCNVHKEVEICGASGHVVNEYCKQVEGNTTKTVGLLDVSRAFPVRGITVQDQAYAVPNDSLPAGYYPALSRMWTRSTWSATSTPETIFPSLRRPRRTRRKRAAAAFPLPCAIS